VVNEGCLKSNQDHVVGLGLISQPENTSFTHFGLGGANLIIGFALQAYL
jgi:hypothetical protein